MKKYVFALVFVLLALSTVALAQSSQEGVNNSQEPNVTISDEQMNTLIEQERVRQLEEIKQSYKMGEPAFCSDYKQGNIAINLTQDYQSYNAGDPVLIRGKVKNNNTYPLIGVDIKARRVKDIPMSDASRAEIMILDEFDVAQNITLPANGEFKVSYTHLLPFNAPSGQYQIYFYAVEQDKFNLAGVSYTNNIVGSQLSFEVKGNTPDHIYLDQTQIKVKDQPYNVMEEMIQDIKDSQIQISIPLYNPEQEAKEMTVTYDLYSGNSANSANKIITKTEEVVVPSKSETILTYTIDKTKAAEYYLSITAKPTDQTKKESVFKEKTISNVRLVIQDVSNPHLDFTTVNTYPLARGQEATLVTCFSDIGDNMSKDISRIETTLTDDNGKEISKTIYEGKISLGDNAIIQKFIPKKPLSNFTILSTIYDSNDNIIDRVEKKYDCKDINSTLCTTSTSPISPLIALASIAIIIGLALFIFKKKGTNIERV